MSSDYKYWIVMTPLLEIFPASDVEPAEHEAEIVQVVARTRKDAIKSAALLMLGDAKYRYCREQRRDGCSPFAGLKAFITDLL